MTGGCGFIGSHITQSLSNKGAQVIAFDNFSSGYRENLEGLSGDVRIIQGDIMDYRKLSQACKGLDVISHQAAQLEITKALADPITDLKVNTEGTLNVFRAAVENGIRKIIYASSAGVYGEARTLPQTEEHPTDPNWPYGVSKLAGEKYADIYSKYYGIKISCLRYGIVYGPREWYGRVLTLFLRRALEGKPPVLWGGDQIRDFIFVTDVVDFHDRLLEESDRAMGVFNVGSGQGTTIRNLAEKVASRTEANGFGQFQGKETRLATRSLSHRRDKERVRMAPEQRSQMERIALLTSDTSRPTQAATYFPSIARVWRHRLRRFEGRSCE